MAKRTNAQGKIEYVLQVKGHEKIQPTIEVTFVCEQCGKTITRWQYPARKPKYCDDCRPAAKAAEARQRMRRLRASRSEGEQPD